MVVQRPGLYFVVWEIPKIQAGSYNGGLKHACIFAWRFVKARDFSFDLLNTVIYNVYIYIYISDLTCLATSSHLEVGRPVCWPIRIYLWIAQRNYYSLNFIHCFLIYFFRISIFTLFPCCHFFEVTFLTYDLSILKCSWNTNAVNDTVAAVAAIQLQYTPLPSAFSWGGRCYYRSNHCASPAVSTTENYDVLVSGSYCITTSIQRGAYMACMDLLYNAYILYRYSQSILLSTMSENECQTSRTEATMLIVYT
jgi:hypothetical protein